MQILPASKTASCSQRKRNIIQWLRLHCAQCLQNNGTTRNIVSMHTRRESVFSTEPSEHNRHCTNLSKDDLSDCATILKDGFSDCATLLKDDLSVCATLLIAISNNDVGLSPIDHPSHGIKQCNKNNRIRLYAPRHRNGYCSK